MEELEKEALNKAKQLINERFTTVSSLHEVRLHRKTLSVHKNKLTALIFFCIEDFFIIIPISSGPLLN